MALIDDILHYWKLDGNSTDAHGSINGTDTSVSYVSALINDGGSFNGTSSRIALSTAFQITTAHSISFWMKSTASDASFDGDNFLVGDGRSGTPRQNVYVAISRTSPNHPRFRMSSTMSGTNFQVQNTAADQGAFKPNNGNWHHVVAVFNGTTGTLYVDNTNRASASMSVGNGATGQIGANNNNGSLIQFFNGIVDEVGVWNKALSAAEVSELYNSGAGLAYPFSAGSVVFPNFKGFARL